jgi:hypothetical protein
MPPDRNSLSAKKREAAWLAICFGRMGDGAEDRSRTDDLLITNQLLYQLSYFGLLLLRLYRCSQIR